MYVKHLILLKDTKLTNSYYRLYIAFSLPFEQLLFWMLKAVKSMRLSSSI